MQWRPCAQKHLGDALAILGIEESDGERLIETVNAYRQVLDGVSRAVVPLDWAMTQNNLGNALQALAETEAGSGHLHQAVVAYQAALQERLFSASSVATANNNLGNAFAAIGERENNNAMLENAASAYRAALEAQAADAAPFAAAKTQMNLAYTLGAPWNRTRNRQNWMRRFSPSRRRSALSKGLEGERIFQQSLHVRPFLPRWARGLGA
jgi:tetratricopeptide (TPR) repeat protein